MSEYDVFISFKHRDSDDVVTRDYEMAKELYSVLKAAGLNPFLSEASLATEGASRYKSAIDDALDSSDTLIVVGTSVEHITSSWVQYEWDSFFNDIISGVKPDAKLFALTSGIGQKDLPRVLRQVQCFDYQDNGIINLCSYLGIDHTNSGEGFVADNATTPLCSGNSQFLKRERKSLYTEHDHGEKDRLESQYNLVGRFDVEVLTNLINGLDRENLYVLDVGCASGYVTRKVFCNLNGISKVIGVDKFKESVDDFNRLIPDDRFLAAHIDVEAADAQEQIKRLMDENNVEQFDIVYSAYTLHHLNYPKETIRKLRRFIRPGGFLFARSADDGSKVYYPDPDNAIREILKKTSELPTVSDRYYGRKMYSDFVLAGFDNVSTLVTTLQTTSKSPNERCIMYEDAFSWRKNNFRKYLDTASGDDIIIAMDEFNWVSKTLDKIEEMFYRPDFYYSSDTFICYGYA